MIKKYGLDIDGVLADFGAHFLAVLGFEDQTPPQIWDDPRFKQNMHKIRKDKEFWITIPRLISPPTLNPTPFCYCTARAISANVTTQWLIKNGFPSAHLFSVNSEPKSKYLAGVVDIFLDDAIHNFEELNDNGIETYLLTRSHNVNYNTKLRVNSIEQFLNKVI